MRIHVRNFVLGARGPSSAVMVEEAGKLAIGTVFYLEVGAEHVTSASEGQKFCEDNMAYIFERLSDLEDDGFVPGWSGRPWTEQAMIEKGRQEAGWED